MSFARPTRREIANADFDPRFFFAVGEDRLARAVPSSAPEAGKSICSQGINSR
jgi:hypothetical protein